MKWPSRKRHTPPELPDGVRVPRGDLPDFIIPWTAIDAEYTKQLALGNADEELKLATSVEDIPNGLPEGWEKFDAPSRDARVDAARNLWASLLEHMPLSRQIFDFRLLDVRLVSGGEYPALAYAILAHETDQIMVFLGNDPRFPQETPRHWSSVPLPLRTFIDEVHSSVVRRGLPYTAFPVFKNNMETLDTMGWSDAEIQAYEAENRIPLGEIMIVESTGGTGNICVSPQLEGKGIFLHSGEPIVDDFWTLYDVAVLAICA